MKRTECVVPSEEVEIQKDYIRKIKEINQGRLLKYSLSTFGCQMNENDSEKLAGMLLDMGYTETEKNSDSDLIIFNTCCVRENAEVKVYGHLGALKKLKREKPNLVIAVCGCMMQQPEVVEYIKKTYRHVELVFGTHNLYRFPELLFNAINSKETVIDVWESSGSIVENLPIERKDGVKAWVTIMYGCNNFCTYCIVPYVRGRERSRGIEDIVKEVTELGQQGYKEITLLGQNVNSYGKDLPDGSSFAGLLSRLDKVEGIERIRFMTSHPKDLSDDFIYAIRDCKKVCEHIHLPIQSGSSRILKEMNRIYSKEHYIKLIEKIKQTVPGISLTTDIIVGFPGENEEDFKHTLDVMEQVRYDSAYTFLYSKRTGTPAAKMEYQISEELKKERFQRLLAVQNRISKELNGELLEKEVEVLVDGVSKNNIEMYTGRTRTNKIVNFKGSNELVGKLVTVRIKKIQTWSLEGEVIP